MKRLNQIALVTIASLVIGAAQIAAAAVISTSTGPKGTFPVSGTDLINTGQVTLASFTMTGSLQAGSDLGQLHDGRVYNDAFGGPPGIGDTFFSFATSDGTVVLATLNTSLAPLGFDITNVVSLTAYAGARTGQKYELRVHQVGAPALAFNLIASVNYDDDNGVTQERQVTVAGNGGGLLASGVDQLQFTFFDAFNAFYGVGIYDVYRELDVFGAPTQAPEPSTVALLGLGGLLLAWRRK